MFAQIGGVFLALLLFANPVGAVLVSKRMQFKLETGVAGQKVSLVSPLSRWVAESIPLVEVVKGVYSIEVETPWIVGHFPYKFSLDGQLMVDPANPNREPDGFGGYNSIVETGFAENPILACDQSNLGPLELKAFHLRGPNQTSREIMTLRYKGQFNTAVKVIYFLDGGDYLNKGQAACLLQDLVKYKRPFIAVFVPPNAREDEYAGPLFAQHEEYLLKHVIPEVEGGLMVESRLVVGDSLAGLAALGLGLRNPEIWTDVLVQSASLWYRPDWIAEQLRLSPATRPFVTMFVGGYETDDMTLSNRAFRSELGQRNWLNSYHEDPGFHNWTMWRNQLERPLTKFLKR